MPQEAGPSLDIWEYDSVGHADLEILNPTSDRKLAELVELLDLAPDARLLDIASGKATFLIRAAQRWNARGVGVDISPQFSAEARQRVADAGTSDRIDLIEQSGAEYRAEPETFDVTSCLGASWIWDGYSNTLDALAKWTRPGGLVISGEPYWKMPADPRYCNENGITPETFGTHERNAQLGIQKGLGLLQTIVSTEDDWDRYQGYQWRSIERYARAHPEDEDSADMLRLSRTYRDSYLRWERDGLGWAIYIFMKDPAVIEAV